MQNNQTNSKQDSKTNSMQDNKTCTPRDIRISMELLDFLTPAKAGNPYSRCDAFHDLMVRASTSAGPLVYMGYDFDLRPGEFIISMTDLAKLWDWHRRTVRYFIDDLQLLGTLQATSYKKFQLVDMVALRFTAPEDDNPGSSGNGHDFQPNVPHAETQNVPHVLHVNVPLIDAIQEGHSSGTFCRMLGFNPAGNRRYSAKQRIETAEALLASLIPFCHSALKSLYAPKVEKAMLDTLYKRCDGNVEEFSAVVRSFAEAFKIDILAQMASSAAESLAQASESAPDTPKTPDAVESVPKAPKAKKPRKTKPKQ